MLNTLLCVLRVPRLIFLLLLVPLRPQTPAGRRVDQSEEKEEREERKYQMEKTTEQRHIIVRDETRARALTSPVSLLYLFIDTQTKRVAKEPKSLSDLISRLFIAHNVPTAHSIRAVRTSSDKWY